MRPSTYRMVLVACLLILVAGGTAYILLNPVSLGVDDAYISYRYAHNLFRGHGLVFNPGERVEGYSNFSYTLLISLAFFFTQGIGVYYFSAFLNLLFACGALLVFAGFLRARLGNGLAAIGTWLFALCLPVWAAVGSGMETCLVLLIYLAIWVVTERVAQEANERWTALLCALSVFSLLSRADGFLMPGAAIIYLMLKGRRRAALACAVTLGVSGFAYELWRYQYYGTLLPNTYYIRVTGPFLWRAKSALHQLLELSVQSGLLPYLLVFLFSGMELGGKWWRDRRLNLALLDFDLFLAVGWTAYWFFVGGDYIGERFLLVLFPLGTFGLLRLVASDANTKAVTLLVVLVALSGILPLRLFDVRFHFTKHRCDTDLAIGRFLQERYPGKSVMTSSVGVVPFLLDSYTVDTMGLVDPIIAHAPPAQPSFDPGHVKFNIDYSLSKRTDLIVGEIEGSSLNLDWGLVRQKYEAAGYRLGYLVYAHPQKLPEPILSVRGMEEDTIKRLIESGYIYVILTRE